MGRFTNSKLADMCLIYGLAERNARAAERLYFKRYPDCWMFSNLRYNLCEYRSLRGNRSSEGKPRYPTHFAPCIEQNVSDSTVLRNSSTMLGYQITRGQQSLCLLPRNNPYPHKLW
ncbi:hypothetical protein TNCV_4420971 [Trichonephila clavipes]|nr:hypothetical protein TNCV_4420971 [Trichonephila clavipes]